MPDTSTDASNRGSIISRGSMLLPKHAFRRLISIRRPQPSLSLLSPSSSPKPVNINGAGVRGGVTSTRNYPTSRGTLLGHGIVTPAPDILPPDGKSSEDDTAPKPRMRPVNTSPYRLQTGYATSAKRLSRPFPPPFLSTPSSSFSDPLTTHSAIRDRRPAVDGDFILGSTNGDDAVFVTEKCLVVNDGVGAWAAKQRGHAALWSRLIGHFWLIEVEKWMLGKKSEDKVEGVVVEAPETDNGDGGREENNDPTDKASTDEDGERSASLEASSPDQGSTTSKEADQVSKSESGNSNESTSTHSNQPDPVSFLQVAFEKTLAATKQANDILGTTTFVSALLHHESESSSDATSSSSSRPIVYVTVLGDSTVLIIRPSKQKVIYRSKEQWHWFDCPRQLGTNSPDTPTANAVMDKVEVAEGDLVIAVSDGVIDNLWEHEVCEVICDSLQNWRIHRAGKTNEKSTSTPKISVKSTSSSSSSSSPRSSAPSQENTKSNSKSSTTTSSPSSNDHRPVNKDHPVVELQGDDDEGLVFAARELVRCAKLIAEDSFAESPYMERAVEEGLPFEGGKMDDITVAVGRVVAVPQNA